MSSTPKSSTCECGCGRSVGWWADRRRPRRFASNDCSSRAYRQRSRERIRAHARRSQVQRTQPLGRRCRACGRGDDGVRWSQSLRLCGACERRGTRNGYCSCGAALRTVLATGGATSALACRECEPDRFGDRDSRRTEEIAEETERAADLVARMRASRPGIPDVDLAIGLLLAGVRASVLGRVVDRVAVQRAKRKVAKILAARRVLARQRAAGRTA